MSTLALGSSQSVGIKVCFVVAGSIQTVDGLWFVGDCSKLFLALPLNLPHVPFDSNVQTGV